MPKRLIPALMVAGAGAATLGFAGTAMPGLGAAAGPRSARGVPSLVCSLDDRSRLWPSHLRTGVRRMLVPPGAISITVCAYNGMNATGSVPQFGLEGIRVTDKRSTIRQITRKLDAIRPRRGPISCPVDTGSLDVVDFGYSTAPGVVVTIDTGGCGETTNGHVHRLGAPVDRQIAGLALGTDPDAFKWPQVVGHLRLCGGPVPGRCYIENYDSGDRVVVHAPGDPWLAMAPITHGRFHFKVAAPGTYTLGFYAGNTLVKRLRRRLTFGHTTHIVFLIPIP